MSSTGGRVFQLGKHPVELKSIDPSAPSGSVPPPPKPLLVVTPLDEGKFPVLVFLHGYLLYNNFYSQLSKHIASHGFVVVLPQIYCLAGSDATDDIKITAATVDWLLVGLHQLLPVDVHVDLSKLGVAGHSRGGKAAFGLALRIITTTRLKISALIGIDPVDGMDKGHPTTPQILTGNRQSFDLDMAVMVLGCGLSEIAKNPLFPACAPNGVNHRDFFDECRSPSCYLLARDYGHMDMLDDDTKGVRGKATYCLCKNGKEREHMRRFVGGAMVAFMRAYLHGHDEDLVGLRKDPDVAPVVLSEVCFR